MLFRSEGDGGGNGRTKTPLRAFAEQSRDMPPGERGEILLRASALKSGSDGAASSSLAQTICPPRDGPDLDHHFVAFVLFRDRLWELDGTKPGPVDHGASSPESLEEDVWKVVQSDFIKVEPESIEFSLLALVTKR